MIDGVLDDEQLLRRFGRWLREARIEAERADQNGAATAADGQPAVADVGLFRLVEEFTALKHEVKLQTRSSRGLEEQSATLVDSLRQAIEALRSIGPKEEQAAWSAGKALALALAELDDSLDRGRQQTEKAVLRLTSEPGEAVGLAAEFFAAQSWFARLLHRDYHRRLLESFEQADRPPQRAALLEALLDGYRLIQKRLTQILADEGVMRIDTVGCTVDPERMVVVEVADDPGMPGGTVCDELRRGYTWKGRVLRYAEVRATRL
ncbi:MAG TPA: nucleotide exchange factor GrpE [Pirellulales bacterium]|nr:nucleotide exchange factor GrpE [Pirellulales bacterium]